MSPKQRVKQLETCSREMFGDLIVTPATPKMYPQTSVIKSIYSDITLSPLKEYPSNCSPSKNPATTTTATTLKEAEKVKTFMLVQQLLVEIYGFTGSDYNSGTSSYRSLDNKGLNYLLEDIGDINGKDIKGLYSIIGYLKQHVDRIGSTLIRQLKRRDALRRQQDAHCDVITNELRKRAPSDSDEAMRFTINPVSGESGFSQWTAAMKMVAQLNGGIPIEFRRRLWLTLANKHLSAKGINWALVEKNCFSEWSHPDDSELGVQIVKDLHRTGCSLFCGEDGQENQALLKRVLLAYARWNKAVGYCQGFNMLAALILQVTEKSETDALKLMIYLIEGVLPDSYFADNLRGLSVDMAVFRELLRVRLPRLSKHLDALQTASKEGTTSYEPPLTNVFTMQWFLTLFCNCLPQPTVLRVWDLILLEGNEILLRTALAIWEILSEKILNVKSADEFYCLMGMLTRELLEYDLLDGNTLVKGIVNIGPLPELKNLREHYMYNITPWGSLPIYYNDMEKQLKIYPKEKLILDISALKEQYTKLKQRQKQAHIIFSAAISRQSPPNTPVAMNHLLLGKSALVPAKRLGPPKGSIPPVRQSTPSTLSWKDINSTTSTAATTTISSSPSLSSSSSSSSSDTELCDDPSLSSTSSDNDDGIDDLDDDNPDILMVSDNTQTSSQIIDNASAVCDNNDKNDKYLDQQQSQQHNNDVVNNKRKDRRNSERALEIIQENSLILHRIMQCQSSRLSPPPSPISNENKDEFTDYEPKYSSILEKSKSLNERYNSLILNLPTTSSDDNHESNSIRNEKPLDGPKYFNPPFKRFLDDDVNFQIKESDDLAVSQKSEEEFKYFESSFKDHDDIQDKSVTESVVKSSHDYFEHLDPLSPKFELDKTIRDDLTSFKSNTHFLMKFPSTSSIKERSPINQTSDVEQSLEFDHETFESPLKYKKPLELLNTEKPHEEFVTNNDFVNKFSDNLTTETDFSWISERAKLFSFPDLDRKDLEETTDSLSNAQSFKESSNTVENVQIDESGTERLSSNYLNFFNTSKPTDGNSDESTSPTSEIIIKKYDFNFDLPSNETIRHSPSSKEETKECIDSPVLQMDSSFRFSEVYNEEEPKINDLNLDHNSTMNPLNVNKELSPFDSFKSYPSTSKDFCLETKATSSDANMCSSFNTYIDETPPFKSFTATELFSKTEQNKADVDSIDKITKSFYLDFDLKSKDFETLKTEKTEEEPTFLRTFAKTEDLESKSPEESNIEELDFKTKRDSYLGLGPESKNLEESLKNAEIPEETSSFKSFLKSEELDFNSFNEGSNFKRKLNYREDLDHREPLREHKEDDLAFKSFLKTENSALDSSSYSNKTDDSSNKTKRSLYLDLDSKFNSKSRDSSRSPKSPNKAFNPFPVTLNTRQNKEVGLKLGLYKK